VRKLLSVVALCLAFVTAAALPASAHQSAASAGTATLKLFWSPSRGDNFSTATAAGENDAINAGYSFVRNEGTVFADYVPGTVALKLYWSPGRGDNFSTATAAGENDAINAGYSFVRWRATCIPPRSLALCRCSCSGVTSVGTTSAPQRRQVQTPHGPPVTALSG